MTADGDHKFNGSVADVYARLMAPMLFEPYARELTERLGGFGGDRVLEVAAGTGVLTRALAATLPAKTEIVATDLNAAMLERAASQPIARPVDWRTADAVALPFAEATFDLVVCQFGVMFVPDRIRAYAEMHRVLVPGGRALFNTWDRLAENELAACVQGAMDELFAADSPRFFARVPHGYFEPDVIRTELLAAGFGSPTIELVTLRSRLDSARSVALALCSGTPLRHELERRERRLDDVVDAVTARVASRFGSGPIDAKMQALVVATSRT